MKRLKRFTVFLALFLAAGNILAQGTAEDYKRAYSLRQKFSRDKVYYSDVNPRWIGDTHSFWYIRHTPEGDRMSR